MSRLNDQEITQNIETRLKEVESRTSQTTEATSYSTQRDVDAIRTMLKIKRAGIQEQAKKIDVLCRRVREYETNSLTTNRVISDEEYAEVNETIVLSEKLRRFNTTERLNRKDIKKLRREITYTDVSQTIGSTCYRQQSDLKF